MAGHLREAGLENAVRETDWILEWASGLTRAALLAHPTRVLADAQVEQIRAALARRLKREPLQYILGEADFFGRTFFVAPGVLIPRPETEHLVEWALDDLPRHATAVDVGTGSGCVAVTLKLERPDLAVLALDVSEAALRIARRNADRMGAEVTFLEGDFLGDAVLSRLPDTFDLLVSNPPYVPRSEAASLAPELCFEPETALFLGEDRGVFVRRLAQVGRARLTPEGRLGIETHAPDAPSGAAILRQYNYRDVRILQDLAGRSRVLTGRRPERAGT